MWIALRQESFKYALQSAILNVRLSNIIDDINEWDRNHFQPWYIYDISIIGTNRQPESTITKGTKGTQSTMVSSKRFEENKSPDRLLNLCMSIFFQKMAKKLRHFQHSRIHCIFKASSRILMKTLSF